MRKPPTKRGGRRSETDPGSVSLVPVRAGNHFEKVPCAGGVTLEVLTIKDERFVTLRSLVAAYGKDPASTRRVLESEGYVVPRFKVPNADGRWRDAPCVGYFQAIAVVAAFDTRGMDAAEKKRLFHFRAALPGVLQEHDTKKPLAVAPVESPHVLSSISTMAALVKRVGNEFSAGVKKLVDLVSHGNETLNERIVNVDAKLDALIARMASSRPQEPAAPSRTPPSAYARPVRPDGVSTKIRIEEPFVTLQEVTDKIDQHLGHGLGITHPAVVRDRAYELGIWEKDFWGCFNTNMVWLLDQDALELLKDTFRKDRVNTNSRTQPASQ